MDVIFKNVFPVSLGTNTDSTTKVNLESRSVK